MAGGSLGDDDDDLITDINVTPLVDVVLVLLIILMVTATAIVSKTLPVELPNAATSESTPSTPRTLGITIDEDGDLFLDRDPVSLSELEAEVRAAHAEDPDVRAILAADGRIRHARVVQIIDLLRRLEVTKFAINVREADLEGGGE
jgi:biopolymer transport protein ExbD